MSLPISVSQPEARAQATVLRPRGVVDASNYQDLIAEARKAHAAGSRNLVLDLSDVPYMSSSGLVALQSIAALLRAEEPPDPESGWDAFGAIRRDRDTGLQEHLKLLNPQPQVVRVLEITGFKRYLEIFTELRAALASF